MKHMQGITENIYVYISFAVLWWFITSARKPHTWFQKFLRSFSADAFQWQKAETVKIWIGERDVNIGQQLPQILEDFDKA